MQSPAAMTTVRSLGSMLKQTFSDWLDDDASRLSAALAFYTALSLAPLLVIVIAISGIAFGEEAARGQIVHQIDGLIGTEGAKTVQEILQSAKDTSSGVIATIISVAVLLFGASGVFGELQGALNVIFEVKPKPGRGVLGVLKDRFFSFTMVLGVGFLLLVSLVLSAGITALGGYFAASETMPFVWQAINLIVSFAVGSVLFALIFKIVPDIEIRWRDVFPGAIATAALFTIGRYLIGLYLGRGAVGSSYGAAGSLVAVLVWVYYSAQILFFGAELTQVYAARRGHKVVPDKDAVATVTVTATAADATTAGKVAEGAAKSAAKDGAAAKAVPMHGVDPKHAVLVVGAGAPADRSGPTRRH